MSEKPPIETNSEDNEFFEEVDSLINELNNESFGVLSEEKYSLYREGNTVVLKEEGDNKEAGRKQFLTIKPKIDIIGTGAVNFKEALRAMCTNPKISLKEILEKNK